MSRTKNRCYDSKDNYNGIRYKSGFKVGIYARVSVDNKDHSIENQLLITKEYIMKHEDMEVVDIYADIGISGKNFNRKEYNRLQRDIECGRINCIVIKDMSRLGRNFLEISSIIEYEMVEKNIRVIAVNDNYDSFYSDNNCISNIILKNMINEIYIRDTGYKIRKSKEYIKKKGAYMGVYAPYGYKLSYLDGIRRLEKDNITYKIVKKICTMYDQGHSYKDISRWLYDNRINTKTDYRLTKCLYAKDILKLKRWTVKSIKETIYRENSNIC